MKYLFALALVLSACGENGPSEKDRTNVDICLAQGGTPLIGDDGYGWEYVGCAGL